MELIKCPMMIKISAYNDILYSSYLEKEARFPLLNAGILGGRSTCCVCCRNKYSPIYGLEDAIKAKFEYGKKIYNPNDKKLRKAIKDNETVFGGIDD